MKNVKLKFSADTVAKITVCLVIIILAVSIMAQTGANRSGQPGMPGGTPQGAGNPGRNGAAAPENAVTVSAVKTTLSSIESLIKLNGDISSKSEVSIYPDTAGKVARILKEAGDTVKKGEIIAYVDPSKPGSAYVTSPVLSTVSGTVIDVPVKTGSTVSTGTAIASVGSLDDLEITVNVAEKYSTYLVPGLKGYITLNSMPDRVFNAHVSKVSPVVNASMRTIEVTLDFDVPDPRIKPGMFGSVRLATQRSDNTIAVPKSALSSYNAQDTVYVIGENNEAVRREVVTGLSNDTMIELVSGVQAGETVITAGSVTNGSKVRIAGE